MNLKETSPPRLTIIIPMYNVAHFLPGCVASVFRQVIRQEDVEIIMVNDGSPDNSKDVAENLAVQHPNIKVLSQENKGLGGARNTGIDHATGEYLLFLDADDTLIGSTLQEVLDLAIDTSVEILEFGAQRITPAGQVLTTITGSSTSDLMHGVTYVTKKQYMHSACNKLYSRKFLNTFSLRFTEKIYAEDFEFNTRAYFLANRVMASDQVLASFLQSDNSITRNRSREAKEKYVKDYLRILQLLRTFKKEQEHPLNPAQQVYFEERFTLLQVNLFLYLLKNGFSVSQMKAVRKHLVEEGCLHLSAPLHLRKKELFRKYLLNPFIVYILTARIWHLFNPPKIEGVTLSY